MQMKLMRPCEAENGDWQDFLDVAQNLCRSLC